MKGDRKWEIAEITIGIFFVFGWDLYSLFFIQGVFKSHLKKHHPHLQCQFPPKIPIWPKSLLYERSEKWLIPPFPPSPRGRWGANYDLHLFCLFLPSQENHLDSQIIPYAKKKFRLMSFTKYDSLFPSEEN